ncbi:MAG: DUF423 domain-containing protein [Gammaproteobacteria bacterium]|nr:DUF423 domain-containing protein [Gammaproteobacteria bacterium]
MRRIIITGILFSALAVALGAFAAHALKPHLSSYSMGIYQTGIDYQFRHSLALIAIGLSYTYINSPQLLNWSAALIVIGILLFSGSLLLLAITETRWLGMITPLGGTAFLAAWIIFAIAVFRSDNTD